MLWVCVEMAVCELCGYDKNKPLGVAAKDSPIGDKNLEVQLNDNGLRALHCPKNHLKDKVKIVRYE